MLLGNKPSDASERWFYTAKRAVERVCRADFRTPEVLDSHAGHGLRGKLLRLVSKAMVWIVFPMVFIIFD